MAYLGIDIGTSSVKVALWDVESRPSLLDTGDGTLLVEGAAWRTSRPNPGWSEADPQDWWQALCSALSRLPQKLRQNVTGIGISTLYPAYVPLGVKGQPVRPAILYNDQRSGDVLADIDRAMQIDEVEGLTANRVAPGHCALTSMMWMRKNEPDLWRSIRLHGQADTFLAYRLTGAFGTDPSHAALSGLAEIDGQGFSERICTAMDIDMSLLPPVIESRRRIGTLTADAAAATGLPKGTPVAMGAGDTPAAMFGAGLKASGDILYVAGTSDSFALLSDTPPANPCFANCPYVLPGQWASIAPTTSSGACVVWFAGAFLSGEDPDAAWSLKERGPGERVSELAAESEPGADGVQFLPYLHGSRTPLWRADARGGFLGLSPSTGLPQLARAVLEGSAFASRHALDALCPGDSAIIAAGGGTRSEIWLAIKAAVFGRPIRVVDLTNISAYGAAMLGAIAGHGGSELAAVLDLSDSERSTHTVEPDPHLQAIYAGLYERFLAAQRVALPSGG